jgi:hypothetical protein
VLLQAAGFIIAETQAPALPDPSDPTDNIAVEARLNRVERAVFGLPPAPGWLVGQAPS